MQQLPTLASAQQGASVAGVVGLIIALVVAVKLGMAIVPAQIGDYQLKKSIANELKRANENNETSREFMQNITRQLNVNGNYDTDPKEVITFTNEKTGQLAVHTKYEVSNNFFANVDIVNRFESDITAMDAVD